MRSLTVLTFICLLSVAIIKASNEANNATEKGQKKQSSFEPAEKEERFKEGNFIVVVFH